MKIKKLRKHFIIFAITFFALYEGFCLYKKYGKLFYIQTYLPTPNLPVQHRKEKLDFVVGDASGSKILCLITTSPKYHQTRAVHVAATWARHCSRAVFLTSEVDPDLADSYVNSESGGYYDLWEKISKAFLWVYDENLLSSYEWILKVDDDTFVFIENLISSLKPYDPNHLIAAGHKLYTWETNEVYLNGGAGYVLSKAAVARLVTSGLRNNVCEKNLKMGSGEDVNMALCLTFIGVSLVDLRDSDGSVQFHIYPPHEQIDPRQQYAWKHLWLKIISVGPYSFGYENMTSQPISFHYVDAETMYLIYYLFYTIKPAKRNYKDFRRNLPENVNDISP